MARDLRRSILVLKCDTEKRRWGRRRVGSTSVGALMLILAAGEVALEA